jgi:hypothetical protein
MASPDRLRRFAMTTTTIPMLDTYPAEINLDWQKLGVTIDR